MVHWSSPAREPPTSCPNWCRPRRPEDREGQRQRVVLANVGGLPPSMPLQRRNYGQVVLKYHCQTDAYCYYSLELDDGEDFWVKHNDVHKYFTRANPTYTGSVIVAFEEESFLENNSHWCLSPAKDPATLPFSAEGVQAVPSITPIGDPGLRVSTTLQAPQETITSHQPGASLRSARHLDPAEPESYGIIHGNPNGSPDGSPDGQRGEKNDHSQCVQKVQSRQASHGIQNQNEAGGNKDTHDLCNRDRQEPVITGHKNHHDQVPIPATAPDDINDPNFPNASAYDGDVAANPSQSMQQPTSKSTDKLRAASKRSPHGSAASNKQTPVGQARGTTASRQYSGEGLSKSLPSAHEERRRLADPALAAYYAIKGLHIPTDAERRRIRDSMIAKDTQARRKVGMTSKAQIAAMYPKARREPLHGQAGSSKSARSQPNPPQRPKQSGERHADSSRNIDDTPKKAEEASAQPPPGKRVRLDASNRLSDATSAKTFQKQAGTTPEVRSTGLSVVEKNLAVPKAKVFKVRTNGGLPCLFNFTHPPPYARKDQETQAADHKPGDGRENSVGGGLQQVGIPTPATAPITGSANSSQSDQDPTSKGKNKRLAATNDGNHSKPQDPDGSSFKQASRKRIRLDSHGSSKPTDNMSRTSTKPGGRNVQNQHFQKHEPTTSSGPRRETDASSREDRAPKKTKPVLATAMKIRRAMSWVDGSCSACTLRRSIEGEQFLEGKNDGNGRKEGRKEV
ncbi:MAG: hypothetical protein Q9169_004557 [Polycauliona sp. 2 TL-2023]